LATITPFLWFDDNAEEAITFYGTVFDDVEILDSSSGPDGRLFAGTFTLNGREFMALNGGPQFRFTEAISLFVSCKTQEEVDRLWDALSAGGEESQCGWLKDKYGLSWQIIPEVLGELLGDPDSRESRASHESDAPDAQDRHPETEASRRPTLSELAISHRSRTATGRQRPVNCERSRLSFAFAACPSTLILPSSPRGTRPPSQVMAKRTFAPHTQETDAPGNPPPP